MLTINNNQINLYIINNKLKQIIIRYLIKKYHKIYLMFNNTFKI